MTFTGFMLQSCAGRCSEDWLKMWKKDSCELLKPWAAGSVWKFGKGNKIQTSTLAKKIKRVVPLSPRPFIWHNTQCGFLKFLFSRWTVTLSVNYEGQGPPRPSLLFCCLLATNFLWIVFKVFTDFSCLVWPQPWTDFFSTKIKSTWTVIDIYHHTTFYSAILKTVDSCLLTNRRLHTRSLRQENHQICASGEQLHP